MAGYRRFIAYVYDYENGKKGSNCGFIKVEVKDQQCSVEVHLHCPGLPENVMCRIYGFTRKDGLINGILLDSCETEKEIIECLIITDALNMNESGIALGKMGGMVIITDNGGFFGTEWDDQMIRPENFRELKAETSRTSDSPVDEISHTSDAPIDESSPNMENINSDNIDTSLNVSAPANISDSSFTATIQEIPIPSEVSEIHKKSPDTFTEASRSVNASENNTSTVSPNHINHNKPNTSFISVDSSKDAIHEGENSSPKKVSPVTAPENSKDHKTSFS